MGEERISDRLGGEWWTAVPVALLADERVSAQAKVVWAALHSFRGHLGICPSRETLAERAGGCSVVTVKRAIAELKTTGWLKVAQKRRGSGNLGVNEYTLCTPRVTADPRSGVAADPPPRVVHDPTEVEVVGRRDVRPNGRNRAAAVAAAREDVLGDLDDFLDFVAAEEASR